MIHILVPLDGSRAAEQVLNHACAIARTFPAELTLLRVISESENNSPVRKDCVDYALSRHQAKAYLDNLINTHSTEKLRINGEVAEGRPAETIVQYIAAEKPDLLVLSRYGRGDARDFAAGGTAQKIVSMAACSVLLLDPRQTSELEKHYKRIIVPIFDGRGSDCTVAIATMIAEVEDSSLLLLYVADEPQLPTSLPTTRYSQQLVNEMHRIIRREAQLRLNSLAAKVPDRIDVVTQVLVSSDPSFAVESTAEDYDCDLLLLHTVNAEAEQGRRHSAITQSLIQYSHRPIFILNASAAEGFASNFRSVYLGEESLEAG